MKHYTGQKHLWLPALAFYKGVSTCAGCGAQAQRITVQAVSTAFTALEVEGELVHQVAAWRFRASEGAPWRGLWRMPPCTRPPREPGTPTRGAASRARATERPGAASTRSSSAATSR